MLYFGNAQTEIERGGDEGGQGITIYLTDEIKNAYINILQETSKFARTALYVSLLVRMYSIFNITITYRVNTLRLESMASKN